MWQAWKRREITLLVAKFEEERYLVDLGVNVRIILKFISKRNVHNSAWGSVVVKALRY